MNSNPLSRLRPAALPLVVILWCAAGCGQKGPVLYPVTGKVTGADGKPLEHATVVFHPVGATDPDAVKPHAKVGPDGAFTLTTHTAGDGAPAGEYRVTVQQWLSSGKGDEPPVNRLPEKYAKPDQSGLTATVNAGPTELTPFTVGTKR